MCLLFETIRLENGTPVNLDYHLKRIEKSLIELFGCSVPFELPGEEGSNGVSPLKISEVLQSMKIPDGICKCRLIYTMGIIDVEVLEYKPTYPQTFMLIECNDIEYKHKYFDRADIEELFGKRGKADEIIIVKNGLLTDTSIANLVFFDGTQFITPKQPLLYGTHRARLLKKGMAVEKDIRVEDIKHYESFIPVNAMSEESLLQMRDITGILY